MSSFESAHYHPQQVWDHILRANPVAWQMEARPTHTVMGRVLFLDEDLNGNRRGVHRNGAQLCSQYVLNLPKNENDLAGLHCSSCGCRDAEHVIISQPSSEPVAGASLRPALAPARQAGVVRAPQPAQREPLPSDESAGATARGARQLDQSTDPLARVGAAATTAARPPAVVSGAPPAATVEEATRVAGRQQTAAEFKAEVEQLVRGEATTGHKEGLATSGAHQSSVDDFKAEVREWIHGSIDGCMDRQ